MPLARCLCAPLCPVLSMSYNANLSGVGRAHVQTTSHHDLVLAAEELSFLAVKELSERERDITVET